MGGQHRRWALYAWIGALQCVSHFAVTLEAFTFAPPRLHLHLHAPQRQRQRRAVAGTRLSLSSKPRREATTSVGAAPVGLAAEELYDRLNNHADPTRRELYRASLAVLRDALRLFTPERVYTSFNGGKDAVVIMHLMRAALARHSREANDDDARALSPRVIYFSHPREFPEVEAFVLNSAEAFHLNLTLCDAGLVAGLTECVERHAEDGPMGFVLGTRQGDPNCKDQTVFTPSSDWMPPFMRVNPILHWTYGQVWDFLRENDLPYCSLYDAGYTSLGKLDDTVRNPALRRPDGTYLPAHYLSDWGLERAGRDAVAASGASGASGGGDDSDAVSDTATASTAGLVVIGDEILSAKTPDSNTAFALGALRELGLTVERVAVVSDDQRAIADEVRRQSRLCDIVITSGGLGPTHDDVTVKAVAEAFGQSLEMNSDMVDRVCRAMGLGSADDLSEAQRKMAMLPAGCRLRMPPGRDADRNRWPILQCENVFVLPGVPQFFERKLQVICDNFLTQRQVFSGKVSLAVDEFAFVDRLNRVVASFPDTAFGSYPRYDQPRSPANADDAFEDSEVVALTVITVDASTQDGVDTALRAVVDAAVEGGFEVLSLPGGGGAE